MKLALAQMKNEGSIKANLEKSIHYIEEAASQGTDLILFPEVQLTEFFPQYPGQKVDDYLLSMDSDVVQAFCEACRRNHIMAAPNIYLLEEGHAYDASILIGKDGSVLGIQKMVHVAQIKQFYEQDYYTPSNDGFHVYHTEIGKLGLVICFDRHYPESIRTEALMGADLILIPTVNTKAEPSEMFEWELRVQAFHNSVAIAMCNRVGKEGDMDFSGESIFIDANGKTLLKADDQEGLIFVEYDSSEAVKIRESRPYTNLRRREFYL